MWKASLPSKTATFLLFYEALDPGSTSPFRGSYPCDQGPLLGYRGGPVARAGNSPETAFPK